MSDEMNYDTMPAGPEMDRMVAEGPMGWKCHDGYNGHHYCFSPTGGTRAFWPSTHIAHAWEVAEKLRLMVFPNKSGWAAAKSRYDSAGEGPSHGETWIDESLDYYAEAPTAQLAICRAALAASLPTNHAGRGET